MLVLRGIISINITNLRLSGFIEVSCFSGSSFFCFLNRDRTKNDRIHLFLNFVIGYVCNNLKFFRVKIDQLIVN